MYKAKVGNSWVVATSMVSDNKYEIHFSTNKKFAKDLSLREVKCIMIDFDNARIIKYKIDETDVTSDVRNMKLDDR